MCGDISNAAPAESAGTKPPSALSDTNSKHAYADFTGSSAVGKAHFCAAYIRDLEGDRV